MTDVLAVVSRLTHWKVSAALIAAVAALLVVFGSRGNTPSFATGIANDAGARAASGVDAASPDRPREWAVGSSVSLPTPAGDPRSLKRRDPEAWVDGRLSRMRVHVRQQPQHDRGWGATSIEFEKRGSGGAASKVLRKDGLWRILSYLDERGAYLLGGLFEKGAWLPLDALVYVDERTGTWRESYVNRSRWMAMTAVPAPNGRFVAFVADSGRDDGFQLQLLDTVTDKVVRVGKPPSPPPLKKEDWDFCPTDGSLFSWGDPVDGYTDMDPGIITFLDERTLEVSYGAARCRRRAQKRNVRQWDIREVFARNPKEVPRRD